VDIRSQILRNRISRQKRQRSRPIGTIALLLAGILSVASAGTAIYGVARYSVITADLPAPETMELLLDPQTGSLLEPTSIYDNSGEEVLWELENPAVDERRYLTITDGSTLFFQNIPEEFILATLTALDSGYLSKPEGFIQSILTDQPDPIPRQLVGELLLWGEADHPYHELRIKLIADQLVAKYGRERILEWFLNSAYFGNQIYGIEQAAMVYFGKSARDLDLSESALLAGVISFPSLNPYYSPDAAKENQEALLQDMEQAGLISRDEENRAVRKQLIYADPESSREVAPPVYVDYILDQASQSVPRSRLLRGGFGITSTLDSGLQHNVECTLRVMAARAAGEDPALDEDCQASRLLPRYSGPLLGESGGLEMNLVMLDPVDGRMLALAGYSPSTNQSTIYNAKDAGTLITPFLYLNAFTLGLEPASLTWDIPLEGSDLTKKELHPGCEGTCDYQGPVSMRIAMVNDYLSPAFQLWEDQGVGRVEETLALFGFSLQGGHCQECKVFSGMPDLDLIELAQGYGVFANRGLLRGIPAGGSVFGFQPGAVSAIKDLSGAVAFDQENYQGKQVISEQLSYLINQVLSDEAARSSGDIFQIGRPAGVKFGYVPGSASAWVVGYTPQILTAVWAGSPQPESDQEMVDYGKVVSDLWRAIIQHASREDPASAWELPPGMMTLDVCYPTGMLPTDHCPRIVREIFIEGSEPLSPDTLYQVREVNRETGLLASVFTPPQLIEERVYLDLPPQAMAWAAEEGIPAPPSLYDLEIPQRQPNGLDLTSPANLSFVRGEVNLTGSIPEEGFQTARLQYGAGMNPTSWLQIGDEIRVPGENRALGVWDTSSLEDGVYAVQLVVVKRDQQLATASLVVSVDNTPPQITLKTDLGDGELPYHPGDQMIFEVEFVSQSDIARVEYYLNGNLLDTRDAPPYIALWDSKIGTYVMIVKAYDLAGNLAELEAAFRVVTD
jgi:membrane peptidoglycan carboxypeptidase